MRSPQIVHDETDLHVPPGEPRDHVEPRDDCESDSSSCCDVESQPGHILKMLKQAPGESAAFKLIHHNDGKTEAIKFPVVCAPVTVPGVVPAAAPMPAAPEVFDPAIFSPPLERAVIMERLGLCQSVVYGNKGIGKFWKECATRQKTTMPHLPWKPFFEHASPASRKSHSTVAEDNPIKTIEGLRGTFPWPD